ncbi:MAG TPA: LysM peptidoglycan-binding domain-containing protein [Candidatus Dormibacteraeota bacterium]|jgi:soluble lytic murein transglycosylase-like protein
MGRFKIAAVPLGLLLAALAAMPASAGQYVVRPGDSLWSISHSYDITVAKLLRANQVQNPDLIFPGQHLTVPDPPAAAAPSVSPAGPRGAAAKAIIVRQARRHDLNPNFALAVSYWESGWNQGAVSSTGAIGLMQVEPYTGVWAGPKLLGRTVNLHDANDNAEVGIALLRHYLDVFNGDPKLALAAYYQGETATHQHGIYKSSESYVNGIWALRNRFQAQGA